MLILLSIVLFVGAAFVSGTLAFHWSGTPRSRRWVQVAFILLLSTSAGGMFGLSLYADARNERIFNSAVAAFSEKYTGAQLLQVAKGPKVWVYNYMSNGEARVALRIGQDWLEVETAPQDVSG